MADGDTIEVEGQYTPETNTLLATKLKLEDDDDDEDNLEVKGPVSNIDAVAFTFSVTVNSFSGVNIAPGTVITVETTNSTTFRGLSGGDDMTRIEFFAALAADPGRLVEVEGHWDGTVLTAFKAKLEDD